MFGVKTSLIVCIVCSIIFKVQGQPVTLTGTVFNSKGTPLEGVTVQLQNDFGIVDTTDSEGRYSLLISAIQRQHQYNAISDIQFNCRNNIITFSLKNSRRVAISLFDTKGRCIAPILPSQTLKTANYHYRINPQRTGSGLYLVKVQVGSETMCLRYLNNGLSDLHTDFKVEPEEGPVSLAKNTVTKRYLLFKKNEYLPSKVKVTSLDGENKVYLHKKDGIQGPCHASYYTENDGRNPGSGNNGSNSTIVPQLVHSENVDRPAINYSYQSFYGINSYNFYGVWKGTITVADMTKNINVNFDISWQDVSFFIDDSLIKGWANSTTVIPLPLSAGAHSYRVDMHNHWHTTGFNVSFTDYPTTDIAHASPIIGKYLSDSCKAIYVAGYESENRYNEVSLNLPQTQDSIVLFLASYNAVNWLIDNPCNTRIACICIGCYAPGSTVTGSEGAPVFKIADLSYSYEDFSKPAEEIARITGKKPVWTYGKYSLEDVEVTF